MDSTGQLVAIQNFGTEPDADSSADNINAKCSPTGSGATISQIVLSEALDDLPVDVRNEIRNSFGMEVNSFGMEVIDENDHDDLPYVMILRRQRFADPGHGGNDMQGH